MISNILHKNLHHNWKSTFSKSKTKTLNESPKIFWQKSAFYDDVNFLIKSKFLSVVYRPIFVKKFKEITFLTKIGKSKNFSVFHIIPRDIHIPHFIKKFQIDHGNPTKRSQNVRVCVRNKFFIGTCWFFLIFTIFRKQLLFFFTFREVIFRWGMRWRAEIRNQDMQHIFDRDLCRRFYMYALVEGVWFSDYFFFLDKPNLPYLMKIEFCVALFWKLIAAF